MTSTYQATVKRSSDVVARSRLEMIQGDEEAASPKTHDRQHQTLEAGDQLAARKRHKGCTNGEAKTETTDGDLCANGGTGSGGGHLDVKCPPGILTGLKAKQTSTGLKKKTVHWPEDKDLKTVRYFELEEGERINVNRLRSVSEDHREEAQLREQARRSQMETYFPWRLIALTLEQPALVEPGCQSTERLKRLEAGDRQQSSSSWICHTTTASEPDAVERPDLGAVPIIPTDSKDCIVQDYSREGEEPVLVGVLPVQVQPQMGGQVTAGAYPGTIYPTAFSFEPHSAQPSLAVDWLSPSSTTSSLPSTPLSESTTAAASSSRSAKWSTSTGKAKYKYKTALCRYYAAGYCNRGDLCNFLHQLPPN